MSARRPFIAGNWKLHKTPEEASAFFETFLATHQPREDRTVVFFPTALSFGAAQHALAGRRDVELGVQNVHWESHGAFTGELSAPLAAAAGAAYVLVGHSERRHVFGETNEDTARKVQAVLQAGLRPVLCVGELLEERRAGRAAAVVAEQLAAVLPGVSEGDLERVIVAYEPVWAIGTGETATPKDASEMHAAVRAEVGARFGAEAAQRLLVLYGGSVKRDNAAELLAAPDVDGVLVGGASLEPTGFAAIAGAG